MPVPKGTIYRMKREGGKMIRLAIHGGKVIEAKVMKKAKKKSK